MASQRYTRDTSIETGFLTNLLLSFSIECNLLIALCPLHLSSLTQIENPNLGSGTFSHPQCPNHAEKSPFGTEDSDSKALQPRQEKVSYARILQQ